MKLKITVPEGNYALRTFDKNSQQVFYTSSRLNGFEYMNNELLCNVPDDSKTYELKDLSTLKIISSGEINVHDKSKNISVKEKIQP